MPKAESENVEHVPGQSNKPMSLPAHALTIEAVRDELEADLEDGLTEAECQRRLEEYGRNELDDGPGVQPVKILIHQIANAMLLVLILAMAVSFGIGSYIEGGVISAVIIVNIIVGFLQEYSAEKTMDSLRSLSSPTASAVREGKTFTVPTVEIVIGDMVELKTGDTIPADVRLLWGSSLVEVMNFETDEALLTGEALPVQKTAKEVYDQETGPGDRLNVAYSSSTVTKGRARGIVFAVGMKTEIGSIAAALRAKDKKTRKVKLDENGKASLRRYAQAWGLTAGDFIGRFLGVNVGTPLQRKLSKLAILLFGIAVICAIIVLGANSFSNNTEVIIYAVATGLSMIPASLIVVLTITMAAGTKQMVQRHVVVRKLDSLEALGAVTDKTGTLTQGKMVTKKAWIPSRGTYSVGISDHPFDPTKGDLSHTRQPPSQSGSNEGNAIPFSDLLKDNDDLECLLNVASLANLAHVHKSEDGWKARGDPTEIAMQVFASRFNWNRERWTAGDSAEWSQVAEFPFDSDVKKMSVIFQQKEKDCMVFTKGAVERILGSCTHVKWDDGNMTDMNEYHRSQVLKNMEALASQGLRVLALASKKWKGSTDAKAQFDRAEVEQELTFQGLIGIYDPPRPESAGAVAECHTAGIAVHMLTGDHPGTAKAIATQVGILPKNMSTFSQATIDAMVMTASSFDKLSEDEIDNLPVLPLVIARCSPNTKVRMIEALHRRKCFAAMTGDGVNDSPSLKRADVGIAMGQSGSDVAKDASDIILTDDNFASILNAVEEGRRMFDNIQKFVLHLLAQNIAQACTLLIGLVFKDDVNLSVFPLSPIEVLWIIMITSAAGLPDMGLGFEIATPDIMQRPPQSLKSGVFTLEIMIDMVVYGLWMAVLCLCAFSLVLFGWGDGQIGQGCNDSYDSCDNVFRARATTFVCLTWFSLFLAWEMVSMRRSFFRMQPGSKKYFTQWIEDVWRNQFLFWSVMAGFITVFPTLYIPVINRKVFKHEGISWEWGIVFVEAIMFFIGIEAWKWVKRAYFRRAARKNVGAGEHGNEVNLGGFKVVSEQRSEENDGLRDEEKA
ncbi:potassium sodium efflux P-type ATPase fungal-type protein [Rutstroemia sp. NJR-2017a BBW]|nr:potassium sodium efflux P-type ATPase fungal-type protein [Rutstroemia sp. NJR-2017a BBW]